MSFQSVTWAFKDLVTSAKLSQMVENTRTHDHRADGSQGDPMGHLAGPAWLAAGATIPAATYTGIGSLAIPALARSATLHLSIQLSLGTATANTQVIVMPTYASDSRVANLGGYRFAAGAFTSPQMFALTIPVTAGPAESPLPITLYSSTAGTGGRAYAWVQG